MAYAIQRMCRLRSGLLGLMLLLPLAARAQQINLTVGGIPASATRLVAVVDDGTISGTLRASKDVLSEAGSSRFALGVPPGGLYRIRGITYAVGGVFPAVLRSGRTTSIAVGSSSTVNASVALADESLTVDPSRTAAANAHRRMAR
jgi:hypothetical protein